jgi:hypothetical protein
MDAIERAASLSVGRACAFGGLAILCFMVGFSYEPHLSARVGGSFALIMALVLAFKSWRALATPYKHTETWLILEEEERPPAAQAQALIGETLRKTFLVYASYSAFTALALLATSTLIGVFIA